ncbi:polysaccharide biosynthesis/export family protein [Geminocystis herdmanii]|uniref:polysaccharide biosynthesis/export family protein n=1 Tax=Geminocystis herdmanii TaxID=669359 RepID=UPI000477B57D|nr:polysaccharide biosynthesis/export family protein [Geminocystis herdmanii]
MESSFVNKTKTVINVFVFLLTSILMIPSSHSLPLSKGDRLQVSIPNEKYFAGVYQVNQDGALEIPFLGSVSVVGLEPYQVQQQLSELLIDRGFFPAGRLQLSIEMLKWSPIQVSISGEVYQPGLILINNREESGTDVNISREAQQITGDFPLGRFLTNAIRSAGGVLPTADIEQIVVKRGELETIVDLSGVFTGEPVDDIPLISGDQIIVPAKDHFQPQLVRPSVITPPGIKVFISNLTIPANSNATSAIGNQQEGITFPYGARFHQAVIAANCAGGIPDTNASRIAMLVRVDVLTGETSVTERKVEELLRDNNEDDDNPFLMARDGVVCYDSKVTSTRDVFRTIADILSPLSPLLIFRNIFR